MTVECFFCGAQIIKADAVRPDCDWFDEARDEQHADREHWICADAEECDMRMYIFAARVNVSPDV